MDENKKREIARKGGTASVQARYGRRATRRLPIRCGSASSSTRGIAGLRRVLYPHNGGEPAEGQVKVPVGQFGARAGEELVKGPANGDRAGSGSAAGAANETKTGVSPDQGPSDAAT